ncbi:hypothetical protein [Roseibacillus ishigakijimensis]|uniref:hypothetical protein n=1 Tax=Roseibacillus ishigakijimensis TaxID=454146 RepID=UPI0031F2F15E
METTKTELLKNDKVAVVHISYDSKKEEAEKWAVAEGFPWLTILGADRKASGMEKLSRSDYIPEYRLVDRQGRAVSPDGEQAIKTAVKLAKGE